MRGGFARSNPTGDEDDALLPSLSLPDFTGDRDLALHKDETLVPPTVLPECCHERDSNVGYPILHQKSSATSSNGIPGRQITGGTNGSSSNPPHATSSAKA
jgi:hypothetical protein